MTVKDSFPVGRYTILIFECLPKFAYKGVQIDGSYYSVELVYDSPNSIAIAANNDVNMKGKEAEFI